MWKRGNNFEVESRAVALIGSGRWHILEFWKVIFTSISPRVVRDCCKRGIVGMHFQLTFRLLRISWLGTSVVADHLLKRVFEVVSNQLPPDFPLATPRSVWYKIFFRKGCGCTGEERGIRSISKCHSRLRSASEDGGEGEGVEGILIIY